MGGWSGGGCRKIKELSSPDVSQFGKQGSAPQRLSRNVSRFFCVRIFFYALRITGRKVTVPFHSPDDLVRARVWLRARRRTLPRAIKFRGTKKKNESNSAAAESWKKKKTRSSQSWPTAPCKFNFPTCLLLDPRIKDGGPVSLLFKCIPVFSGTLLLLAKFPPPPPPTPPTRSVDRLWFSCWFFFQFFSLCGSGSLLSSVKCHDS